MKVSSVNQESKETASNSKLFGLPRPLIGTGFGILFFLLLAVFSRNTDIAMILLSPGYSVTAIILEAANLLNSSKVVNEITVYSISSLPCAIIGSLIIANKQATRDAGFILSGIYLALLLIIGFLYFMIIYASWA